MTPHRTITAPHWGLWASIDFSVPAATIAKGQADNLRRFLHDAIEAIGMTAYGEPLVEWFGGHGTDQEGYTALQLITTSHIAVHAPFRPGRVYTDVFSCRAFDPIHVVEAARATFGGITGVAIRSALRA